MGLHTDMRETGAAMGRPVHQAGRRLPGGKSRENHPLSAWEIVFAFKSAMNEEDEE
jgi:hypothetical protein